MSMRLEEREGSILHLIFIEQFKVLFVKTIHVLQRYSTHPIHFRLSRTKRYQMNEIDTYSILVSDNDLSLVPQTSTSRLFNLQSTRRASSPSTTEQSNFAIIYR